MSQTKSGAASGAEIFYLNLSISEHSKTYIFFLHEIYIFHLTQRCVVFFLGEGGRHCPFFILSYLSELKANSGEKELLI